MSLADLAAAGHLSTLDFCGDVDWAAVPAAHDWYARMKSRPSFRPILADRVAGVDATGALRGPGFLVRASAADGVALHARVRFAHRRA